MKTKILVVDDHQLVRDGFMAILSNTDRFEILGELENGQEVLPFIKNLENTPDIILMDLDMPGLNGIETTKRIKSSFPEIKVLILTMHDDNISHNMAVAAKANGFMAKNISSDELIKAIETILSGEDYFQKRLSKTKAVGFSTPSNIVLTSREEEVLKSIANGLSNKEIAQQLGISHRTVDTHRTNLKEKLKVNGIAGLVRFAFKSGLIN